MYQSIDRRPTFVKRLFEISGWRQVVMITFCFMAADFNISAADPVVSNVYAQQRSGTSLVDILYDLTDSDSSQITVTVAVSDTAGSSYTVPAVSFSGDVGDNISPGSAKKIVWDAGKDWANKYSVNMRFRLCADDSPITPELPRMAFIAPGTFMMGSPDSEIDRSVDETQHMVTIRHGYWISKHEVTQAQYQSLMGTNPAYFTGDLERPVENVSWHDATNYCGKLTAYERAAGRLPAGHIYRLPTEAEWEYACRAGTTTATAFGDSLSSIQANFDGNNPYNGATLGPHLGMTMAVGRYAPNAWGLYDMHGNVWELCLDWYAPFTTEAVTDPAGPASGMHRTSRGGCLHNQGKYCRSASRLLSSPDFKNFDLGFRPVLAPGQ